MRLVTAFGSAALIGLSMFASIRPSAAMVIYPWCANYSGRMGGQNCGFTSLPQCLATQRGNGGSCGPNAWYQPYPPPPSFAPPIRR
jgi:hypothetical protein